MKKIISAALVLALMLTCVCALGEGEVTAEALLAGNRLYECLENSDYTREYVEHLDADGNVRDYNDIIYKRGTNGYNMVIIYPENSGETVNAMLVGGNFYVEMRDGVPAYTLYASAAYVDAGSELILSDDTYIAYPAAGDGLELSTDADGSHVVTARVSAGNCDPDVISAHGHDAAADEPIFDEYVYDSSKRLTGETLYYLRGGEKRVCMRTAFEYDADGTAYESYAQAESAREISVVLNPDTDSESAMSYRIGNSGTVRFILGEGMKLYADEACTQEVPTQGECSEFSLDVYYAKG